MDALMIVVEGFNISEVAKGMFFVTHTIIAEGEHIFAMDKIFRVERILPNEQVWQ